MPDQFVVPQFIDIEATIIGKVTARQFAILIAVGILEFIIYRLFLNIFAVLGLGIPVLFVGLLFAFAKVNGQPFHHIVLNMVQTLRRPGLRIWDKKLTDSEIKLRIKKEVEEPAPVIVMKKPISRSRLSEMSLVVNTGGVYKPEIEQTYGEKTIS